MTDRPLPPRLPGLGAPRESHDAQPRTFGGYSSGPGARVERPAYDAIRDAFDELLLVALDRPPIWSAHILTTRRPHIPSVASALAETLQTRKFTYLPMPVEDYLAIARVEDETMRLGMMVSSDAVIAGDRIAYATRFDVFEVNEEIGFLANLVRWCCLSGDVLDFPDAELLDAVTFSDHSLSAAKAYAEAPARQLPFFLLPHTHLDSRRTRVARAVLAQSLLIYGLALRVPRAFAEAISGLKIGDSRHCAVALPAPGTSARPLLLETVPGPAQTVRLTAGLEDFLAAHRPARPAWAEDPNYAVPRLGAPALNAIQLMELSPAGRVKAKPVARDLVEDNARVADESGWDLHAPVNPPEEAEETPPPVAEAPSAEAALKVHAAPAVGPGQPPRSSAPRYPQDLADLTAWAKSHLPDRVHIAPRALRQARKVRHPDPERVARALELLAGPRYAMFAGDRDARLDFEQGLLKLRLRDGFSNAEHLVGRTGADYVYHHRGRRILLDRHLASTTSGFNDPKMIRIYYAFDRVSGELVVGWLPTHLMTTES